MKYTILFLEPFNSVVLVQYKKLNKMKTNVYFKFSLGYKNSNESIGATSGIEKAQPIRIERVIVSNAVIVNDETSRLVSNTCNIRSKITGKDLFLVADVIDDRFIIDADNEDQAITEFNKRVLKINNEYKLFKKNTSTMIPFTDRYLIKEDKRSGGWHHIYHSNKEEHSLKERAEKVLVTNSGKQTLSSIDRYFKNITDIFGNTINCIGITDPENIVSDLVYSGSYYDDSYYTKSQIGDKLSMYLFTNRNKINTIRDLDSMLTHAISKTGIRNVVYRDWDGYSPIFIPKLYSIFPWQLSDKECQEEFPEYFNIPYDEIPDFIAYNNYKLTGTAYVGIPALRKFLKDEISGKYLFLNTNEIIDIKNNILLKDNNYDKEEN